MTLYEGTLYDDPLSELPLCISHFTEKEGSPPNVIILNPKREIADTQGLKVLTDPHIQIHLFWLCRIKEGLDSKK